MEMGIHIHVSRNRRIARRRGFTLIDSALAVVIIGTGVVAMMKLLAAGSISNYEGSELTTAVNLANNIHEILLRLPLFDPSSPTTWSTQESDVTQYNDVVDFDGCTFNPPIDVRRQAIANASNWSQVVTVQTVPMGQVSTTQTDSTSVPTARVTVQIMHQGHQVYQTNWLVVATLPN